MGRPERIDDVHCILQTARREPKGIKILQDMSQHFDLKAHPPHHTRPTAAAIIRGIVSGDFDVVPNGGGKGFWHEPGYQANEESL